MHGQSRVPQQQIDPRIALQFIKVILIAPQTHQQSAERRINLYHVLLVLCVQYLEDFAVHYVVVFVGDARFICVRRGSARITHKQPMDGWMNGGITKLD